MTQPGPQQRTIINNDDNDEQDADFQKALALSLQDHHHSPTVTFGQVNVSSSHDEEDEELKQALALSLQSESEKPQTIEMYAPLSDSVAKKEGSTTTTSSQLSFLFEEMDLVVPQQLPAIVLEMEAIEAFYNVAEPFNIEAFHSIMWDENLTTENDKNRWIGQGIDIRTDENETIIQESPQPVDEMARLNLLAKSHIPWGLVQQHGGPCGVLAAVQAEMLRYIIWGPLSTAPFLSGDAVLEALARALGTILARASLAEAVEEYTESKMKQCDGVDSRSGDSAELAVKVVLPTPNGVCIDRPLTWEDFAPWQSATSVNVLTNVWDGQVHSKPHSSFTIFTITSTPSSLSSDHCSVSKKQKVNNDNSEHKLNSQHKEEQEMLLLEEIDRLAQQVAAFLLQAPPGGFPPIHHFRHSGGVLLLVMSLVASRTPEKLRQEFDDPNGTRLTGQFGHCSQELINLLLTGQAVSNVFDNILKPSGDMICRGICTRPTIGYLSQLEALQYCSVGSYFKSPRVPVWIIASTSHFSILFGPKKAIQESASDILLDSCRRAFKSVEGGEEHGFIPTESLPFVLNALDYELDAPKVSALSALLEVAGAGIILWDDFWKTISRLMTGATLEAILEGDLTSETSPPSHLAMTFIGPEQSSGRSSPVLRVDEKSEKASNQIVQQNEKTVALIPKNTVGPLHIETDEEMARRLANEWNNEDESSVNAVNGGSPLCIPFEVEDEGALTNLSHEDSKPGATLSSSVPSSSTFDFETYGNTFPLFHYNGLRGGVLTPFRVTRLTPEEAVGASIALSRANSSSAQNTDLEEVIRTKWPSCAFNFFGKPPPVID